MEQTYGTVCITHERIEQIVKHGWDMTNDADYGNEELLQAALFCIDPVNNPWPFGWSEHFKNKIINKDRDGQLTVAGAFIAAELDRRFFASVVPH